LHFAASRGHIDCAQLLCTAEYGGKPNAADGRGITPLYLAAQQGHVAIVRWLVDECSCDPLGAATDGMTPAHAAAQLGHVETLAAVMRDGETLCADVSRAMHALLGY
jgi:ankyrin repeat protein